MIEHERLRTERGSEQDRNLGARDDPVPGAVVGLVTMATLGTAFGLLALGIEWFWIAFPVGFSGVMPIALGAAKRRRDADNSRAGRRHDRDREHGDETDAALARLRERYARGELDEAAFEDRLERLLRTEDVAAADEFVRGDGTGDRPGDRRSGTDGRRRRPRDAEPGAAPECRVPRSAAGIEDAGDRGER